MKKKLLFISAIAFGVASVSLKNGGGGLHVASTGAPASSTGAIGETTCAKSGCHDDNTVNNSMSTTTLLFGNNEQAYVPGNTYPITVKIESNSIQRFGYELVAIQDNDTANAGTITITNPARTQIVTNGLELQDRKYATYTFNGTDPYAPGTGQWTFDWIAPAEGTGSVTFYLATVAADNDGTDDGDYVYTKTLSINEVPVGIKENKEQKLTVFPNPTTGTLFFDGTIKGKISAHSMDGKLIKTWQSIQSSQLDLSNLEKGTYIFHLHKSNTTTKVVLTQ